MKGALNVDDVGGPCSIVDSNDAFCAAVQQRRCTAIISVDVGVQHFSLRSGGDIALTTSLLATARSFSCHGDRTVVVTVAEPIVIDQGAVLSVGHGVRLIAHRGIRCIGRLDLRCNGEVEAPVSIEGNGSLTCSGAPILVGCLSLMGNAAAYLQHTTLQQKFFGNSVREICCAAVVVCGASKLCAEGGTAIVPLSAAMSGVRAEQDAEVDMTDAFVYSGCNACVHLVGCAGGVFDRCVFMGQVKANLEARAVGLLVERGSRLRVSRCVVCQAFYGYVVIGTHDAAFDGCAAYDVGVAFTINSSTVALWHSFACSKHLGVQVLNGSHCTIASPECDVQQLNRFVEAADASSLMLFCVRKRVVDWKR